MTELTIIGMALLALGFVAYPLVRAKPEAESGSGLAETAVAEDELELTDLLSQRDAVYGAIKEIEFDHQLGNLSDTDYADLRERYKAKALATLKEIHDREATAAEPSVPTPAPAGEAADPLEEAIRSKRRGWRGAPLCAACGLAYLPGERFCKHCGQALAQGCPICGQAYDPAARFCPACGAPVGEVKPRSGPPNPSSRGRRNRSSTIPARGSPHAAGGPSATTEEASG